MAIVSAFLFSPTARVAVVAGIAAITAYNVSGVLCGIGAQGCLVAGHKNIAGGGNDLPLFAYQGIPLHQFFVLQLSVTAYNI